MAARTCRRGGRSQSLWGNTVRSGRRLRGCATGATSPTTWQSLTALLDAAILAALPERSTTCWCACATGRDRGGCAAPDGCAAAAGACRSLRRYPETRAEQVLPVIDGLFERVVVGLPGACSSLDDDAAQADDAASIGAHPGKHRPAGRTRTAGRWQAALRGIVERATIHGLVRGVCCRLAAGTRSASTATNCNASPAWRSRRSCRGPVGAAWIEGVLHGSAFLLLQHDGFWVALDRWMSDLDPECSSHAAAVRRAFATFERPNAARWARRSSTCTREAAPSQRRHAGADDFNHERAALVIAGAASDSRSARCAND